MNIDWHFILSAVGLALIIEGIPYFAFAEKMPEYLKILGEQPPAMLRVLGLAAMLGGLALLYFFRTSS